jgi:hypothetical protein
MLREAADVLRLSTRELGGLNIRSFRGALPVQQGATFEDGLRDACAYIRKARTSSE